MPNISVIVPVYNVQDYLDKCVTSILNQSYVNFELILIDDGSSDKSSEICDSYAADDSRVVVIHQDNGGVSSARNKGLSVAKSDWITFVDSDDWVESNYLFNFRLGEESSDIYIQGLQFVNSNTMQVIEEKDLPNLSILKSDFYDQVPKNNILSLGFPVCKLFKKDIIEKNNICFDEQLSHHEDHIFVFEYLMYVNKMTLSSGLNYNYRYFHNPNSLSSRPDDVVSMKMASKKMLDGLKKLLNNYQISDEEYIKRIGTLCVKPVISAIISEYSQKKKNRYQMLINNIPSPDTLKAYYYPSDSLGKVIKYFAEKKMPIFIDWILSLYHFIKK